MSYRVHPKPTIVPEFVRVVIIDSLCGAGGFTEGAEQAVDEFNRRLAIVACGINHDKLALESHAVNHPETVHFREDIRNKLLPFLIRAEIEKARKLYPNAIILFHCSLECTNFSNAKGGGSRDMDSRSLACFMPTYLEIIHPDIFTVENVREFKAWGPLVPKLMKTADGYPCSPLRWITVAQARKENENHINLVEEDEHEFLELFRQYVDRHHVSYACHTSDKPDDELIPAPILVPENRTKGKYYMFWRQYIEQKFNCRYDSRLHNTADFGANTSRTRYFAQFVREGLPIIWPDQTHAKNPTKADLFDKPLKKWRPIRECLELEDKGRSIFRNPPLSDKTYERIFEGLIRHVGNGDRAFLSKYFTGEGMNYSLNQPAATITAVDHNALVSVQPFMARLFATASNNHGTYPSDQPATTITTADGHAIVTPEPFAMTYNSGSPENRVKSLDEPAQTLLTENTIALVTPNVFCMKYHGTGITFPDSEPCSTLTNKDRVGLVQTKEFVSLYYSNGKQDDSVNDPAACVTTNPHHRLVSALFVDQQYGQSKPSSIDDPAPCITVNPHCALVEAFIQDPQWGGHSHGIDQPGHTIIARQDKAPSSLVTPEFITQRNGHEHRSSGLDETAKTVTTTGGNMEIVMTVKEAAKEINAVFNKPDPKEETPKVWAYVLFPDGSVKPAILVYETDSMIIRKIKAFMAEYGIVDILMRMLKVKELKLIQGFPENYVLLGSQTHQKKFIGNSVPPAYPKAWMTAIGLALRNR